MRAFPLRSAAAPSVHAPEQLFFADILPRPRWLDGLFLAIFPDAAAAASLARLARGLRAKHGLCGQSLATDRFHISLHCLGTYVGLHRGMIERATEAASTIAAPPFDVTFDRVMSFQRNQNNRAFVLRGSGLDTLKRFRQDLGIALIKTGVRVTRSFTPHVTLLYDEQIVPEETIEPVSWTVNEFALVHSQVGQMRHIIRGRWPLRG
jgi:RNA 2',3'-cyclic 3'-phosphodiesterase